MIDLLDNLKDCPLKILFVVELEIEMSASFPLIEALLAIGNLEVRLSSPADESGTVFRESKFNEFWKRSGISWRLAIGSNWDYVIYSRSREAVFDFVGSPLSLMISHCLMFGNSNSALVEAAWKPIDIYCGVNGNVKVFLEKIAPSLFRDPDKKAFVAAGSPLFDQYLKDPVDRAFFLRNLGLSPERKTVVLASHWLDGSCLGVWGSRLARYICQNNESYNVIQTGHPNIWQDKSVGLSDQNLSDYSQWKAGLGVLKEELAGIENEFPGFKFLPELSPKNLFSIADVVLSDFSSLTAECALMGVPVLYFDSPLYSFFDPGVKKLYRNAGLVFTELGDVTEKITYLLDNADTLKIKNQAFQDRYLPANLGTSASYLAGLILRAGAASPSQKSQFLAAASLP